MNGIALDDSLLPKEKEKQYKKALRTKIFFCLLLSNTTTFLLFYPWDSPSSRDPSQNGLTPKKGFGLIQIPLNNFTGTPGVVRGTLFKKDLVLIKEVYLHAETKKPLNDWTKTSSYLLEVPINEMPTLIKHKGKQLSVFPYGDYPTLGPKRRPKGVPYEIRF